MWTRSCIILMLALTMVLAAAAPAKPAKCKSGEIMVKSKCAPKVAGRRLWGGRRPEHRVRVRVVRRHPVVRIHGPRIHYHRPAFRVGFGVGYRSRIRSRVRYGRRYRNRRLQSIRFRVRNRYNSRVRVHHPYRVNYRVRPRTRIVYRRRHYRRLAKIPVAN